MTLEEYVAKNRKTLDRYILGLVPNLDPEVLDDDAREDWIANDECLYNEALAAGVEDL
jgi:hypothetical protein